MRRFISFGVLLTAMFVICQTSFGKSVSFGAPVSGLLCVKGRTLADAVEKIHNELYSQPSVQLHFYDQGTEEGPWIHSITQLSNLEAWGNTICVTVHGRNGKLEGPETPMSGIQPGQPGTFIVCPRYRGKRNGSAVLHKVLYDNLDAIPINIDVSENPSDYQGPWIHDPKTVSDVHSASYKIWGHVCALVEGKFGKNPLIE